MASSTDAIIEHDLYHETFAVLTAEINHELQGRHVRIHLLRPGIHGQHQVSNIHHDCAFLTTSAGFGESTNSFIITTDKVSVTIPIDRPDPEPPVVPCNSALTIDRNVYTFSYLEGGHRSFVILTVID